MKNIKRAIWGLIFIAAAVVIALNSFNIINFDIFFDGWWTLFIIVPSLSSLITDNDKIGALFGLGIGIFLLLCAQDILSFEMFWKLLLPGIIAYIGLKMLFSAFRKNKAEKIIKQIKINGRDLQKGVAVFSGTELNFDDVVFDGADLIAVFGGVECDLRHAIIDRDCVINVLTVFGGAEIYLPKDVNVVTNVSCAFGGVDSPTSNSDAKHTIYIQGTCVFGGVDVK